MSEGTNLANGFEDETWFMESDRPIGKMYFTYISRDPLNMKMRILKDWLCGVKESEGCAGSDQHRISSYESRSYAEMGLR